LKLVLAMAKSATPWETKWEDVGSDMEWMQNFEEVVLRVPIADAVGRADVLRPGGHRRPGAVPRW